MTTHSRRLILYHTAGCHLCEEARQLLAQLPEITAEEVDIGNDPLLAERYGTRIPVLVQPDSGLILNWPFTLESIRQWIHAGQ